MSEQPKAKPVLLRDGFVNMAASIGGSRDKASHSSYAYRQLHQSELAATYKTSWAARKIVDIIPDDATKRWRTWQADTKVISDIEKAEKGLRYQDAVRRAMCAARLYGGAAIYPVIKGQASAEPLIPESVRKDQITKLIVLSRYQLLVGETITDLDSDDYGEPAYFTLATQGRSNVRIHPSRLSIFMGAETPEADGTWVWGDSILQHTIETVKQLDGFAANVASLAFEMNVDVLTIPRLMEMLAEPGGDEKVATYLTTIGTVKGVNKMLVLDGGDTSVPEGSSGGTKYERKPASFTGLADIWEKFMQVVSGSTDIPATRFFGRSPSGLNSTGESDMHNYRQHVSSVQSNDVEPAIRTLDECVLRSALGDRPKDLYYDWRPVYEPTDKEKVEVGKTTAEIIKLLSETQLFPVETLQDVAVSAMVETGALPGLESAIDEFGLELEDEDGDEDALDLAAEAAKRSRSGQGSQIRLVSGAQPQALQDAAPLTLYVARPVLNAKAILKHYEDQGATGLEPASELHVTIVHSKAYVDWMDMPEAWSDKIELPASGQRLMDKLGDPSDPAEVLLITSSMLKWRHSELLEHGAKSHHPTYRPHITLAYGTDLSGYKPWDGPIVLGPEQWSEVKGEVDKPEDAPAGVPFILTDGKVLLVEPKRGS